MSKHENGERLPLNKHKDSEKLPSNKHRNSEGLPFIAYNKSLTTLARENRKNPTPAEQKIWQCLLRLRQTADYKFLRQKPIGGYILDFYCSKLCLAIEIDGDSHAKQQEYDKERTKFLNACGIQVLRYSNDDVLHNMTGIYEHLIQKINTIQVMQHE